MYTIEELKHKSGYSFAEMSSSQIIGRRLGDLAIGAGLTCIGSAIAGTNPILYLQILTIHWCITTYFRVNIANCATSSNTLRERIQECAFQNSGTEFLVNVVALALLYLYQVGGAYTYSIGTVYTIWRIYKLNSVSLQCENLPRRT
ncbi:MAG: hypothetical protein Tsb0021_14630 [Chlamydiales bacterium]